MKVMLLFPPNWTPSMPHLALPTLTAYLRANDVEVIQRDLNATTFDQILTREYVVDTLARLRDEYGADVSRRPTNRRAIPKREQLQWALREGPSLANDVQRAKRIMRSEEFFEGEKSLEAFETVIKCLEIASLPFYPATLNLQTYISAYPTDGSASLIEGVQDENHNIFLDIFRKGIRETCKSRSTLLHFAFAF